MPTEKNAAFLPTQYSFKLDRQRVNMGPSTAVQVVSQTLCSKILSALWCTVLHERKFPVHANIHENPLLDSTVF